MNMNVDIDLEALMAKLKLDGLVRSIEKSSFSSKEQQAFLEDLSSLIDDGVAPNRAVATIAQVSSGTTIKVAQSLMKSVAAGKFLADGMVGWFSVPIVELVRAGEEGGSIAQTMRAAADSLTKKNSTLGSVMGSLSYPLVVIIMGIAVTIYINHSVLNQFASIKPIAEWPANGQALVAFANFWQSWWWLMVILILALGYGIMKMLVEYIGDFRDKIDVVPLLSLYRRLTAARFMETMGLLISNGVVFKRALKIMHDNASSYFSWHLMLMERRLSGGHLNIADVLDTGMIDKFDILRLRAISEAHGFEHALVRQGKAAGERATKMIKATSKVVGGILLAVGTALAAFIITAIYMVGASLSSGLNV